MRNSPTSKICLILLLASAPLVFNACGKNKDEGTSTTSQSMGELQAAADKELGVQGRRQQAGGTVTTFKEDDGSEHSIWADDNVANEMADGTQTIAAVCKGSTPTATDKNGRSWGYENNKSCIIL